MKLLLTVLLLAAGMNCSGQIALALSEYNILYRGYTNQVEVGTQTKVKATRLSLYSADAQFVHKKENQWNVITTTTKDTIEIVMLHAKTGKVIDRFFFRVKDLPNPDLYVGATQPEGKISKLENRLFARYSDSPLRAEFRVIAGALMIENDPRIFEFDGNKLGEDYLEYVKNIPGGRKVTIKALIIGVDRKERIIWGEYVL